MARGRGKRTSLRDQRERIDRAESQLREAERQQQEAHLKYLARAARSKDRRNAAD